MGAQRRPHPDCACDGIASASAIQIPSAIAAHVTSVDAVVGAGGRQFTIEPSGATIRIGRSEPKLIGIAGPIHTNSAWKHTDAVLVNGLLTKPRVCRSEPSKSKVSVSSSTLTATRMPGTVSISMQIGREHV